MEKVVVGVVAGEDIIAGLGGPGLVGLEVVKL